MNYYKSRINHINLFKPSFAHQNLDAIFNIGKRVKNGVLTPICFSFEAIHTSIGIAEDFLIKEYDIGHFNFREHDVIDQKIFVEHNLRLYRLYILDYSPAQDLSISCQVLGLMGTNYCPRPARQEYNSEYYCNFHYVKKIEKR